MDARSDTGASLTHAWAHRYASHLGYRSADAPLFVASARDPGPLAQIEIAAQRGLAGVQYALAVTRSEAEQTAVGERLQRYNLATGCMVYAPFETLRLPYLSHPGVRARETFLGHLRNAFDVASRIHSTQVVVLAAADPDHARRAQIASFIEHLKYATELAERAGVMLELELVASTALPPLILERLDDVMEVIERVASPHLRMIFDTAHVEALEGNAAAHLPPVFDYVDIVQLADHPGRLEPGTGTIDFTALLTQLHRRTYRGLVELEHGWSVPGEAGEREGLQALQRLDARVHERLLAASAGTDR